MVYYYRSSLSKQTQIRRREVGWMGDRPRPMRPGRAGAAARWGLDSVHNPFAYEPYPFPLSIDAYFFYSIIPRLLGGSEEGAPWPSSSAYVSFAGPVDLDTYHINEDAWPEHRVKTSVFVKLGSYLAPEDNRPPHKGIHTCHVLVLFPLDQ